MTAPASTSSRRQAARTVHSEQMSSPGSVQISAATKNPPRLSSRALSVRILRQSPREASAARARTFGSEDKPGKMQASSSLEGRLS